MDDVPLGVVAARLPGTLWDPRVRRYRSPAACHAQIVAALAAAGVEVDDRVAAFSQPPGVWTAPALRPYQQAAVAAWQVAGRRGVVVLPTGSGKTRVAMAAMASAGCSALCLVPTRVLLDQWCEELASYYDGAVGRFGDGDRERASITVSTYASAARHMASFGNRFELLIVDEAHHVAAGGHEDTFDMAIAPFRLGLTATPPRSDDTLDHMRQILGPIVYELAVGDLAGRFLAPFDLVTLSVELTPHERDIYERERAVFAKAYRRFVRNAPGAEWADFSRHANRSDEGRRALAAWRRSRALLNYTRGKRQLLAELLSRHRDARTLVFTAGNASAYDIARQHLIMPITCDIKRREREAALERFRTGELMALVSARVLNEGIDVPDAEVAIIVGGSQGEREHVQRIGRLLRPRAGKRAVVYELVARRTAEVRQANRRRAGLAPRVSAQL